MTPQPSGEAVLLVRAALHGERELSVYENGRGFQNVGHAVRTRMQDKRVEALFAHITALESQIADLYRCPACNALSIVPERCPECGNHREAA
jgi:rubrerythrin